MYFLALNGVFTEKKEGPNVVSALERNLFPTYRSRSVVTNPDPEKGKNVVKNKTLMVSREYR